MLLVWVSVTDGRSDKKNSAFLPIRKAPRQMQEMEVSKPITLDPVSVVILQQSFVISSVVQEILKQIIFVLREKADKVHR